MPKMTSFTTVAGLNRALKRLPDGSKRQLREASRDIAGFVARDAQTNALRVGGVATLVAPTIKPTFDRVPTIRMGGTKRLPTAGNGWSNRRRGARESVGDVIMGAEFGGGARVRTRQFEPHRGTRGYFLWPAVRQDSDKTQRTYSDALFRALRGL